MSEGNVQVQLNDVCLKKGSFALQEISFSVREEECFILLGPSGTGKTTVLETIAGLNRPSRGEIWIGGKRVTRLKPEQRHIGYVPQDYALFPHLSVRDNLTLACRLKRLSPREMEERLAELTALLHIGPLLSRRPSGLSGGEKQRVALARALMVRPQVLLLDEPLSALDAATRGSVRTELRRLLRQSGATSLIVTHDFVDALTLGDQIGVMDQGRIVQIGTPEELLSAPKSRFVADFTGVNFWEGQIQEERKNGWKVARVGEVRIYCNSELEGKVLLTFFPSEVRVSLAPPNGPDQNILPGTVRGILHLGDRVRLSLDCGLPLAAEINVQTMQALGLREDDEVFAAFPATSVKAYLPEGSEGKLLQGTL